METITAKLYEGMFLVDSALAASDWDGINEKIKSILEKFGAEIVSMKKWDERRLAYPVNGKTRGTYILVFFRVDGPKISDIERTIRLTEDIIRVLILTVEDPDESYISKAVPADKPEEATPEQAEPDEAETDDVSSVEEDAEPETVPDEKSEQAEEESPVDTAEEDSEKQAETEL